MCAESLQFLQAQISSTCIKWETRESFRRCTQQSGELGWECRNPLSISVSNSSLHGSLLHKCRTALATQNFSPTLELCPQTPPARLRYLCGLPSAHKKTRKSSLLVVPVVPLNRNRAPSLLSSIRCLQLHGTRALVGHY
uniref:Uncharacterized protein n=1 Tax=Physcomitrium patens TaxID=3218 RepID=A0A2K1J2V7_PHYPA|nr:hypothetical protein PHYPA_021704 [Physcomitrium patens]